MIPATTGPVIESMVLHMARVFINYRGSDNVVFDDCFGGQHWAVDVRERGSFHDLYCNHLFGNVRVALEDEVVVPLDVDVSVCHAWSCESLMLLEVCQQPFQIGDLRRRRVRVRESVSTSSATGMVTVIGLAICPRSTKASRTLTQLLDFGFHKET